MNEEEKQQNNIEKQEVQKEEIQKTAQKKSTKTVSGNRLGINPNQFSTVTVESGHSKAALSILMRNCKEQGTSPKEIRNSFDDAFRINKHKNKISSYRIRKIRQMKARILKKRMISANLANKKSV